MSIPHWVKEIKSLSRSSDMRKVKVDDCVCCGKLIDHDKIRDRILNEIEKDICIETEDEEGNYLIDDKVSKLDWTKASDFTRPWVKTFLPHFDITIKGFLNELGYPVYTLDEVWYQQYKEGDTHGWHTHGSSYTGVYYLEFPEGSSKTELYSPFNFKKHIIKAKEGDLIIFPSHIIHRGPPNTSKRKTIISFNFTIQFWNRAVKTKLIPVPK